MLLKNSLAHYTQRKNLIAYRVLGIDEKQNYGKISFTGKRGSRKLTAEFLGIRGEKLGEWSVMETELKTPSPKK